ncbi:hypothetical protein P3T76_011020 [Phytophthora citrophthora]|uniref:Uncharacterized protein n=1 Tax=Phytophthora citrophthora TaxID=4793 RepID=A0AAD9G9P6_9STRA|nr:hypothetical protein P3T76_011020 [Phytophthora citrophthora]
MGKAPEHRVFSSSGALRYRRKVPAPVDNQQPEPTDVKQELKQQQQQPSKSKSRSSRFRPKSRQANPQQPALLKQLLWKAKTVQPTQQQLNTYSNSSIDDEEEDEEEAFAREQRKERKLLATEAEALVVSKTKTAASAMLPSSDAFVAESSSQETQSGSEDEAVFMPYRSLLPTVQPGTKWGALRPEEDGAGSGEETDGEEVASPVVPSGTVEPVEEQTQKQNMGLEKESTRRKHRQNYKQKQKQKRAAAKEKKRLQYHQKQEVRSCPAEEDVRSMQDDSNTTVDIFHPPTNLTSEMDAGVCRAVLSQLKEVVPFIVVGDVACPMMPDDPHPVCAGDSDKREVKAAESEDTIVDFRQHVISMLDRSKETQILYRESFVVEDSGFDAASSYDFFKSRTWILSARRCLLLFDR